MGETPAVVAVVRDGVSQLRAVTPKSNMGFDQWLNMVVNMGLSSQNTPARSAVTATKGEIRLEIEDLGQQCQRMFASKTSLSVYF